MYPPRPPIHSAQELRREPGSPRYNPNGLIGFGFIAYVLIRIAQRAWRTVHPLMYAAAIAFVLYFLVPLLQDNFDWI